ncbi:hypothetical protein CO009_01785 [Candidatus Shapirobacteria bacterium CG_4_8_14_3_um_filter_35_11]|uniref:DUF4190 domain-containing protein n=4 Tax=Candidatus Shapironibacteriota TaxID=1752721 RepID=A0A1J5I087_9BACT|nr:MAG: hypothetical protein AUK05_01085 [Candidatus Shapirobacteria bacterium CG2_30_35_20]PIX67982.1 MAG: hypothetical protein COZ41_02195 [Candidatus Shapirobacteria bacterium CG_4_10_14_3_um_filter_35_13]PJA51147.1 MAG: hypothetical protein CO168_01405 [Candidatus Shapirobacteria bacterium CG_4_9_14_3_um_filter_36_12]PJC80508.1 MAG: hypothetical protein CO009_01785 [Candidatus Shapirobacteria bacterium CG_4_8_14_3_um_filter_35_11]
MKNIKNIHFSLVFTVLSIILLLIKGGILSGITALIGLIYTKKALKNNQKLGTFLGIVNLIIISYYLFVLFIIGYVMTSR